MKVVVNYRTVRETVYYPSPNIRPEPRSVLGTSVDIHDIEDHDSVMRDAYGYLSIVTVDEAVFLYPTANVVKVEITS